MAKRVRIEGLLTEYVGAASGVPVRIWTCGFNLRPWRQDSGPWQTTRLLVWVNCSTKQRPQVTRWKAGDQVRIAAMAPQPAKLRGVKVDFLAKGGALPVQRFRGLIAEIDDDTPAAPDRIKDRVLGTLVLDDAMDWYSVWRSNARGRYETAIQPRDATSEKKLAQDIQGGRKMVVRIERGFAAMKRAVTNKLLPLYNTTWRGARKELTAAAFAKNLELVSLIVAPNGSANAILECNKMFTDHGIEVRYSRAGKITGIDLA